jgi:hypothetical protein
MFLSGPVASECEHLLAQPSYPKLSVLSDTTLSLVGVSGDSRMIPIGQMLRQSLKGG